MSKDNTNNLINGLWIFAAIFSFAGCMKEKMSAMDSMEDRQIATVIGRHTPEERHEASAGRNVVYMDLDMDGDKNTAEASLEIVNKQVADPLLEKTLPNGTTRSVSKWKELGRFYKDYQAYNL